MARDSGAAPATVNESRSRSGHWMQFGSGKACDLGVPTPLMSPETGLKHPTASRSLTRAGPDPGTAAARCVCFDPSICRAGESGIDDFLPPGQGWRPRLLWCFVDAGHLRVSGELR